MPIDQCSIRPENQMPRKKGDVSTKMQGTTHGTNRTLMTLILFAQVSICQNLSLTQTLPKSVITLQPLLKYPSNLIKIDTFIAHQFVKALNATQVPLWQCCR